MLVVTSATVRRRNSDGTLTYRRYGVEKRWTTLLQDTQASVTQVTYCRPTHTQRQACACSRIGTVAVP